MSLDPLSCAACSQVHIRRLKAHRVQQQLLIFHLCQSDQLDPPATVLFDNLERICRGITVDFYQEILGKGFKKSLVHPVNDLIRRREAEFAAGKTCSKRLR